MSFEGQQHQLGSSITSAQSCRRLCTQEAMFGRYDVYLGVPVSMLKRDRWSMPRERVWRCICSGEMGAMMQKAYVRQCHGVSISV